MIEQDVGQFGLAEGTGDVAGVQVELREGVVRRREDGPLTTGKRVDQARCLDGSVPGRADVLEGEDLLPLIGDAVATVRAAAAERARPVEIEIPGTGR